MISQGRNVEEVRKLVNSLESCSKISGRGKAIKTMCLLFDSNQYVVSWKFQEWDYGKKNVLLPCNARGLFITDNKEFPEIVVRGYDKFFNIDEISFTKWESIAQSTVGPYTVTLKSNGCIIFISGLKDGTLVVCSKHSTGPRDDVDRNHAECGRKYLLRLLNSRNVDVQKFACKLYDLNVTLVAEYCDDSFEEHILEYSGNLAGLYLHGINLNRPEFVTWPMGKVNSFAQKYGFKPTTFFDVPDIKLLRTFLDRCSHDGTYNGREIEGFVIRTHLTETFQDFFFKVKFEEPYLMYRQWREVTKQYISNRSRLLKFKKHKFITNKYLDFVIPILDNDPSLCERYMRGFGIIKLRDMFLKSYGMSGSEILNQEKVKELELTNVANNSNTVDEKTKFLIFPVSVIGCGKTTTALTLTSLFRDWGHVQNDDITGRDKSMLMKKSLKLLQRPDIRCVFVDRNNHQYRERQQLFDWVEQLKEDYLPYDINIKIVGLSFASVQDMEKIRKLTIERVLARGDNHQSIKCSIYGKQKILGIMNGFFKRYQEVNENMGPDNLFDYVIYLNSLDTDSSLFNVKKIAEELRKQYPAFIEKVPIDNQIEQALKRSLEYTPVITKKVGSGNNKKSDKNNDGKSSKSKKNNPIFFSAVVSEREKEHIFQLVRDSLVAWNSGKPNVLLKLIEQNRFQSEFHVTLCHVAQLRSGTPESRKLWISYLRRYNSRLKNLEGQPHVVITDDEIKIKPINLCWDDKIVSVIVELSPVIDPAGQILPDLLCGNAFPHITIGILQDNVKPSYSNELCQRIFSNNTPQWDAHSLELRHVPEIRAHICIHF